MHHPADLEQHIQIARHPRARRQLFENLLRLQVQHVLGTKLRGCLGQAVFVLNPAFRRFLRVVLQQQQEDRISDCDLVSVAQPRLFDGHSIHRGAVAAIEIAYLVTLVVPAERAMASREGKVVD